jgi:hypothetical protein
MQWLDVLGTGACASTLITAVMHTAAHRRLRQGRRPARGSSPSVSILKPLKGDDDEFDDNLASLARQRYGGELEILLAAADPGDPALDAAQRLRRRFPGVAVRVVPGRAGPEPNPKVANLVARCHGYDTRCPRRRLRTRSSEASPVRRAISGGGVAAGG